MQIPQTSYNEFPATMLIGQVTENNLRQKKSAFALAAITVGTFVLTGTADDQCKAIPDATAALGLGTCLGVAAYDAARSPYSTAISNDAGAGQYLAGDDVPVLRNGEIVMWSENACTKGNPVYVRTTASGTSINGQVRDGAATSFVLHPTATFASSTTAAGLAKVEVK